VNFEAAAYERLRALVTRCREGRRCARCGVEVNPLLHIAEPWRCGEWGPLGGRREPHKDEL